MPIANSKSEYQLKLSGPGLTINRPIPEAIARRITNLVMGGGGIAESVSSGGESVVAGAELGDGFSAKSFMAMKRPNTDMERITCLAFYLTHNKHVAAFKTKELTDLNTEAAQPKLSNASAAARNAVVAQYLSLAGGGKKQITSRGEAVVQALPDREKVKSALEGHQTRKPRKPRARKTRK